MADDNQNDDFYDDPATIGDTRDEVTGDPDNSVPAAGSNNLSDSIVLPEKHTTDLDDRGPIDELEMADRKDTDDVDDIDPALRDDTPSSQDGDGFDPAGDVIADEQDGTNPA